MHTHGRLSWLTVSLLLSTAAAAGNDWDAADAQLVVLLVSQGSSSYDMRLGEESRAEIVRELRGGQQKSAVLLSDRAFGTDASWGHYTAWTLLPKILSSYPALRWLIVMETESRMAGGRLRQVLESLSPDDDLFIGHGLVDVEPVITHHFYGADPQEAAFEYPDIAAGVVLSRSLVRKLASATEGRKMSDFAIDPKHEFARFILEATGARLRSQVDDFCLSPGGVKCAVWFEQRTGTRLSCLDRPAVTHRNLFAAVKTFSGFHKTRVVIAKRTWTKNVRLVEFFSDVDDQYIPAKSLGIANVDRGHCAKSMAILMHALEHEELTPTISWILIADDDTLVGLSRLFRWLRCYDYKEKIILGERYGYGYAKSGSTGYDYPTGGSGMVFSLPAARALVEGCACPTADSPDDMIIGMCARRLGINLVHSTAMHQARSIDYARPFLLRVPPISLHKHHDIDPYRDFMTILHEEEDDPRWNVHQEL